MRFFIVLNESVYEIFICFFTSFYEKVSNLSLKCENYLLCDLFNSLLILRAHNVLQMSVELNRVEFW